MAIRKEALGNKAFMQMKGVYDDRTKVAIEWKKQGKKVVGVLGFDVPDELLMAAGLLPYRIDADATIAMDDTDKYLEFSFPLDVRSQFEKIIGGAAADVMDYLVISNSTDALQRIYYYIREVKALEPEKGVPEIYFIDWLFTKFRMHQVRNERILNQFREQLEVWIGRKIEDEDIVQAAKICNRNRRLLEEVARLRREGRITGTEAMIINVSSVYMEKEKHSLLIEELLEEAKGWPVFPGKKIFVTGSQQDHREFYDLLENLGMYAVSEDHDWGDRNWNKQTNTDLSPIKAIVDRYMLRSVSTKRSFVSERVQELCNAVKATGAQGVVSYTYKYDDAPSWDVPEEKAALGEMNIPMLQLMNRPLKLSKDKDTENILKAFADEIKEG